MGAKETARHVNADIPDHLAPLLQSNRGRDLYLAVFVITRCESSRARSIFLRESQRLGEPRLRLARLLPRRGRDNRRSRFRRLVRLIHRSSSWRISCTVTRALGNWLVTISFKSATTLAASFDWERGAIQMERAPSTSL